MVTKLVNAFIWQDFYLMYKLSCTVFIMKKISYISYYLIVSYYCRYLLLSFFLDYIFSFMNLSILFFMWIQVLLVSWNEFIVFDITFNKIFPIWWNTQYAKLFCDVFFSNRKVFYLQFFGISVTWLQYILILCILVWKRDQLSVYQEAPILKLFVGIVWKKYLYLFKSLKKFTNLIGIWYSIEIIPLS